MEYFYLEVTKGVEQGIRYILRDGAISIGRSSSNTIALHSTEKVVSSHHAIVYKSPDKIMVQDMQSTNGTFINEKRIEEKEISPNDIIGFGKLGPRIKLIVSETELTTGAIQESAQGEDTNARTVEDDSRSLKRRPTESEVNAKNVAAGVLSKSEPALSEAPSVTIDMENKLMQNRMGTDDMHSLMKNGRRLKKILDKGNLNEAQSSLLVSAYGAGKKTRKQWIFAVSLVIAISLIIILFLEIRIFQYKQILNKGLSLEDRLDSYEKIIFQANNNPEINKKELVKLILELEETKKQLASVKENLRYDDFEKFYSDPIEKLIDDIMIRFGEADYHIPPKMVERVKYHISVYSGRLRNTISRYLKRKDLYFPDIKRIFKQQNLPVELAYVSMLESGFNPKALSHAGARGLWQFMPHTAREYGLKVNETIDERCDPIKATYAAAKYFNDLISIFGGKSSVMLAMAAYNAGEGRVEGALRKIDDPIRNRDFWYIYRMGYLAEETNEYIPRIFALMIIDEYPAKFNFETSKVEAPEDDQEDDFIELLF